MWEFDELLLRYFYHEDGRPLYGFKLTQLTITPAEFLIETYLNEELRKEPSERAIC